MRHYATTLPSENTAEAAAKPPRSDWQTLARLLPYLWTYKWRVIFALGFMVGAKMANVSVPLLLKQLIDSLTITPGSVESFVVVPLGLLVAYGLLRLSTTLLQRRANWFLPKPLRVRPATSPCRYSSTCID